MSNTNLPSLESTTKCTLKFNDIIYIPVREEMTAKLFSLMADQEKQNKIRAWLTTAEIKLIHYNEVRHIFKLSHKVLISAFWYIVNKVVDTTEEYQLTLYKNLILNVQRTKANDLEEIKSFVDMIANYSIYHFKVLRLIDGVLDYFVFMKVPLTNTIPDTLAKCIEYGIPEMYGESEKRAKIWNDLFKTGLRRDARIHMWMNDRKFVWMSLLSEKGKEFIALIKA